MSYLFQLAIKRSMNFESFISLEIENEPTSLPIKYYEIVDDYGENFRVEELEKIMIRKNDWPYPTIYNYHESYLNKKTTPSEVADRIIKIFQSDIIQKYNAIVEFKQEKIIQAARESKNRYEKGCPLSVVDGVPFVVQEHFYVEGYSTYYGVSAFGKTRTSTAFPIQKLLDAGAILVGTTSMPGIGANNIGVNSDNRFTSPPNPWNHERYSGGTPGNGVILALGICPFAIGSDSTGSIRSSAGYCGLVGLKPTFSRVSVSKCLKKGFFKPFFTVGVLGCCSADAAIILNLISLPDRNDEINVNQPKLRIFDLNNFIISKIKFGMYKNYINLSEKYQTDKIIQVAAFFEEQGCLVKEIIIPEIVNCTIACLIGGVFELPKAVGYLQKYSNFTDFNDISLLLSIAFAKAITAENETKAQKQRTRMIQILDSIFYEIDVIILPTTSRIAPIKSPYHVDHGFIDNDIFVHSIHYLTLASLAGIPSISLNVGYDEETKLPISIQLMSKWWTENLLFMVANSIENKFPLTKIPHDFQKILD